MNEPRYIRPLLRDVLAQAAQADASRSVAPELIAAIKRNDIMRMSATPEIGGLGESIVAMGDELRAIAAHCTSTAWCVWNHLCVFHHFAALLGPRHSDFLRAAISRHEWFCFPAGASSDVKGRTDGARTQLEGVAAFGSGARYAEWAGVAFMVDGKGMPRFTVVDLRDPKVRIRATWDAMSLRGSATDHVHYEGVEVPSERVVPLPPMVRARLRDPKQPVIHPRYREDWVGLSVLWLGAMATGVAEISFTETATGIRDRLAILGTRMADRPTIHVNLGRARALINAATDTVWAAMAETDARIAAALTPSEADYFRQTSAGMQAVHFCDEAMRLILRVLGGNGLREGTAFERRYRDFQAMPLHINGHIDRITEQLGRLSLGLDTQNPF
ncbi:MAG TPA: acyl-CoA dehydrogenase family protein [Myxococcota bacterium]|nr:acyl-CoA dehydrogenase family protein [Myxococcota bacterium]